MDEESPVISNMTESSRQSQLVTIDSLDVAAGVIKALRSSSNSNRFYKQNASRDDVLLGNVGEFNRLVDRKKAEMTYQGQVGRKNETQSPGQKSSFPRGTNRKFVTDDPKKGKFLANPNDDNSSDDEIPDLGFDLQDDNSLGSARYDEFDFEGCKHNSGEKQSIRPGKTGGDAKVGAQPRQSSALDEFSFMDFELDDMEREYGTTVGSNGFDKVDESNTIALRRSKIGVMKVSGGTEAVDVDDVDLAGMLGPDSDDEELFRDFTAPSHGAASKNYSGSSSSNNSSSFSQSVAYASSVSRSGAGRGSGNGSGYVNSKREAVRSGGTAVPTSSAGTPTATHSSKGSGISGKNSMAGSLGKCSGSKGVNFKLDGAKGGGTFSSAAGGSGPRIPINLKPGQAIRVKAPGSRNRSSQNNHDA